MALVQWKQIEGNLSDDANLTGSLYLSGAFYLSGSTEVTENLLVVGSITGSSFTGEGSNLFFTTLNTNQPSNSTLLVGNIYGTPYEYKQTTVFKNADIIISGALYLEPQLLTPDPLPGGLFFSASSDLFVGVY